MNSERSSESKGAAAKTKRQQNLLSNSGYCCLGNFEVRRNKFHYYVRGRGLAMASGVDLERLPYWGKGPEEDITKLPQGIEARVTREGRVFFVK